MKPLAHEQQLAQRACNGDVAAFSVLVGHYEDAVFSLCNRYLRSGEADEAAQDALVKAFTHIRSFDPARPLGPWLFAIARRQCLDRLRRRKFEVQPKAHDDDAPPLDLADPNPVSPELRLDAERALALLQTLDEGPREALAMFHLHEMPYQEIADALEVPIGTVMTWLHRGREKLRVAMGSQPMHDAGSRKATASAQRRVSP